MWLALWFGLGEKIFVLVILIATILAFELMNSALERVVDLVTEDFHILAQKAKDMSAAAVLVLSLAAFFAGSYLFISYKDQVLPRLTQHFLLNPIGVSVPGVLVLVLGLMAWRR